MMDVTASHHTTTVFAIVTFQHVILRTYFHTCGCASVVVCQSILQMCRKVGLEKDERIPFTVFCGLIAETSCINIT